MALRRYTACACFQQLNKMVKLLFSGEDERYSPCDCPHPRLCQKAISILCTGSASGCTVAVTLAVVALLLSLEQDTSQVLCQAAPIRSREPACKGKPSDGTFAVWQTKFPFSSLASLPSP